jgi:cystathionine beta-lyase/cystathionine gamma-synthase
MKAHEQSALAVARRLQAHEAVETVCHPGLANQLAPGLTGTSGLFSFIFRDGIDIRKFSDHLKLFRLGVSWGGHESLIVPGDVVLSQKAQPNSAVAFGISPRSVRLHVGLEGTEALWSDLEAAITAASSG